MATRRWGDDAIQDYKSKFQSAAGKPYSDSAFQSPDNTPIAMRQIVAAIKVLEAQSRQLEIMAEVRQMPKSGDAHMVPKEKAHLLDEHTRLAALINTWGRFQ